MTKREFQAAEYVAEQAAMPVEPTEIEWSTETEIELLKARKDELRTLANHVDDIFAFFDKNSIHMENQYDGDGLDELADELRDHAYDIESEIEDLEDSLEMDSDESPVSLPQWMEAYESEYAAGKTRITRDEAEDRYYKEHGRE
jgi:hypothetical protein